MTSSELAPSRLARPLYAGLIRRLTAHLLDVLITFSVVLFVALTLRVVRPFGLWIPVGPELPPEQIWGTMGVTAKLFIVLAFVLSSGPVYFMLWEASPWQATFGKRLLHIYVTDDQGERISLAHSIRRWLARWVFSWLGGSLISMVTIAATESRKALHYFVGKTLVLRGRPVSGGDLETWRIVAAFGFPFVWLMGTFLATI